MRVALLKSPRLRKLLLGAVTVFVLMLTVPHFVMTRSGAYKLAVATARRNPRFTEALGSTVHEAWFSGGKVEYGNPPRAELSIPVRGQQEKANLIAEAIEVNGRWELTKLVLDREESGQQIDLLLK